MKAVIMAGGFGTRLRPLTNTLPKPMIPMANKPMMEHIVDLLRQHGMTELVTLLHFQPELIERHFGDGTAFGVHMTYVSPKEDYGTAGAVKNAEALLGGGPCLVISGDVLTDFDLGAAVAFHRERRADLTILLTRVENPLRYGVVITEPDGRISRFLEKPTWSEVFSDTVNTGIYLIEPSALALIPPRCEFDFSKDLFPLMMRNKLQLFGYVAEGYWRDVGDLQEYRLAHRDILKGKVKVCIPGRRLEGPGKDVWLGPDSRVDYTADLRGMVLIGKGAQVEAGARISNSVIGDGCSIAGGATVSDSVLWSEVAVGPGATLEHNVVGRKSHIQARARLFEGAIVGDACRVGEGSVVNTDVKIWPEKVVEDGAVLSASLVWGDRWARSLFGAYGITGLGNAEISPEFAAKVGAAFGATLREHAVVCTSRDPHRISRLINRAIISGLLSTGVDVHDLRVTPIPVVRYQMGTHRAAAGVHVRRSPFDPELVDIKFFDERGMDISSNREKSVERLFFREDFRRAKVEESGRLAFPEYDIEFYREGILRFINQEAIRARAPKVVIDYAYGSAATIFPHILGKVGCQVIALNAYMDETRLVKTAAEFQQSVKQLSEIVRILGADLGFLLDAGAEKLFLVDDKGDPLSDDLALAVVAFLVARTQQPGTIGVPITASGVLEELVAPAGCRITRAKIAPRALMEAAGQDGVIFVGDAFGGFIFPHFQPAFDAMLATLKILEMLALSDLSLHEAIRHVPRRVMVRGEVPCPWERKGAIMRTLIEATKEERVELLDGVKIHFGADWTTLYPDPDRPVFHILAEAPTRARAEEIVGKYREQLTGWLAGAAAA
ncbi:MAG TPA: mannose-1-phosphate guanyltransferase [Candidatus Baltobacteraceae bacterium]|nr:mannose-1-phosphate guanyltransferase [Candidatus Baltobacteraceae bacterium]